MSKTIFVIGASSALAKDALRALRTNHTVITGGRQGCDVACDINRPITLPAGVDVVVNFAAAFGGTDDRAIQEAVQTNELGMLHVSMAAAQAGNVHVVAISSMSATHQPGTPYYSIYALTKRHGDELAQYYCAAHNVPLTILRPSQLYGDDPGLAKHQPFFYGIIDQAAEGRDITIYGQHDPKRNYLHISDLSALIERVAARTVTGVYPCLGASDTTFGHIARTAQKVFGRGGRVVFQQDKPDTPDNIFPLDMSIYNQTGYQAQVSLEQGIRSIQQYRQGEK